MEVHNFIWPTSWKWATLFLFCPTLIRQLRKNPSTREKKKSGLTVHRLTLCGLPDVFVVSASTWKCSQRCWRSVWMSCTHSSPVQWRKTVKKSVWGVHVQNGVACVSVWLNSGHLYCQQYIYIWVCLGQTFRNSSDRRSLPTLFSVVRLISHLPRTGWPTVDQLY